MGMCSICGIVLSMKVLPRFLVKRENGGARGRLVYIYIQTEAGLHEDVSEDRLRLEQRLPLV